MNRLPAAGSLLRSVAVILVLAFLAGPEALSASEASKRLTAGQLARIYEVLEKGIERTMIAGEDGSVEIELGTFSLIRNPDGKDLLRLRSAVVHAQNCSLFGVDVKGGRLLVRSMYFDFEQIQKGRVKVVGAPVIIPEVTLERSVIENLLAKKDIRDPRVTFENGRVLISGRVSHFFGTTPFRMAGRLRMDRNRLCFDTEELYIKGKRASKSRMEKLTRDYRELVNLDGVVQGLQVSSVFIQGGQLEVHSGMSTLYSYKF